MVGVLVDDGVGDRQQGNLRCSIGLCAVGEDPSVAIDANYNIGFCELNDIAVSKAGIAAEKKNVTHLCEAFDYNLLFSNQQ